MQSLRSVVYVSDATFALTLADLEALLVRSREDNRRNGITGVLLYNDGNIMQCFEGPEAAVVATYARIRTSRRHKNLIELMNRPVALRSFGDWEMALVQTTRSDMLALATARWKEQAGAPASPGEDGLNLMKTFWQASRAGRG